MADISLVIDVKQNGVTQAVKNTKTLETNAKLLSKAWKSGALSQRQYYKGMDQLANSSGRTSRELRDYATSVRKVEAETKKARIEDQRYARARKEALAMNARFNAEKKKEARDAREIATANRRLRMEYKQGYAAKVQLRAETMRLGSAMRRGVISAEEYKVALDRLGQSAGRSGRSMSRSGVLVQQSGYQIGDFMVQVQSGTNAMVAFGQQATQMAGTLTLLQGKWIWIGTVLGVTIPLLTAVGAYLMRTRKAGEEGSKGIQTYADAAKEAREEIRKTRLETEAMNRGFRDTQELTLQQGIEEATADILRAQMALRGAEIRDASGRGGPGITSIQAQEDLKAAEDELEVRKEVLRLLREQRATQEAISRGMEDRQAMLEGEVEALEERADAVQAIRDAMASETADMQNRIALLQTEAMFGKESKQLAELQAQQARDAFIEEQKRNGILGNNLKTQLEIYDAMIDAQDALVDVNTNQEIIKKGAESFLAIWQAIKGVVKETNEAMGNRSNLTDSQYQQMLYYQQYAETMGAAPDEPVRPPSVTGSRVGGGSANGAAKVNIEEYLKYLQTVVELEKERADLATSMAETFADGVTSIVDGTATVKDAFRSMARDILKQLWDVYVMQKIIGVAGQGSSPGTGLAGAISSALPSADGGGYTGSGARSGGMDGKGGFMAMLHPQETVIDHTKGQSSGGNNITINQSYNFSANGDDSVKRIIAEATPRITQATQRAIIDQRRRGGAMKSAFG